MQFRVQSNHVDRFAYAHHVFAVQPGDERRTPFGTLDVTGVRNGDAHPPQVCLFFGLPSEIDELIRAATKLRDELAAEVANQIERERHQRESEALPDRLCVCTATEHGPDTCSPDCGCPRCWDTWADYKKPEADGYAEDHATDAAPVG
jgi:hypothetical protein